jgi:predicted Zn-ribbon and HTH transcriptional regulator
MAALLSREALTAREISAALSIPEKAVAEHLLHLRRTVRAAGGALVTEPAECLACGFRFARRERATTPSRCPVCRDEGIAPPRFSVRLPARGGAE